MSIVFPHTFGAESGSVQATQLDDNFNAINTSLSAITGSINATNPPYNMSPSASAAANTNGLQAAVSAGMAAGVPVFIPAGAYSMTGSGAVSNTNGAALIINNVNNPSSLPIRIFGAGYGLTILRMAGSASYNVIEIVNTASSVISMPVEISEMTLDGNGAAQTQQAAGDRYQNGLYCANVSGLRISVEAINASYHGVSFNNCRDTIGYLTSTNNYCDGVLITGNPALGASPLGQHSYYYCQVKGNGIVQGGQLDTTYCGVIIIEQRGVRVDVVSTGHVNHAVVVSPASGSAVLCNTSYGCTINIVSDGDRSALLCDGGMTNNIVNISANACTQTAIQDVNLNATHIQGNTFNVNLFNCLKMFDFGNGGGSGFFQYNTITGSMMNLTAGGTTPMGTTNVKCQNNTFSQLIAGDQAATGNISNFAVATSDPGGNEFLNMNLIGTFSAGAASLISGFTGSGTVIKNVTGFVPAITTNTSAGTSPYAFPKLPYDANYSLNTLNGITGYALDGNNLAQTIKVQATVKANHVVTVSWTTTAPTFDITPQV